MHKKKKVLIFIDWFLPAYKAGGPIRSVANMVEYLDKDYQFYIYTGNKDYDGTVLKIDNNAWLDYNQNTKVYYSSNSSFMEVGNILKHVSPDVIYINSIFSLAFTIYPLKWNLLRGNKSERKVVIAPRGMLQEGALKLKATKKRIFLSLMRPILFKPKNVVWQSTDKQETTDIRNRISEDAKLVEVGNIPTVINKEGTKGDPKEEILFTTISLVAEKKNHIYFIKLLQDIECSSDVVYDIYGPIKDKAYWAECQEAIKELPNNIKVNYKGSVEPHLVSKTLEQYHYFVLPTLGENFGHAIFEALANGVPVLISDKTPWLNLQDKKAGWSISLEDKMEWESVVQQIVSDELDYNSLVGGAGALADSYVQEQNFNEGYGILFND